MLAYGLDLDNIANAGAQLLKSHTMYFQILEPLDQLGTICDANGGVHDRNIVLAYT